MKIPVHSDSTAEKRLASDIVNPREWLITVKYNRISGNWRLENGEEGVGHRYLVSGIRGIGIDVINPNT